MERIAMSQEERDWLEWLKRAQDGLITQRRSHATPQRRRIVRRSLRRQEYVTVIPNGSTK
jgi:hypothetical protein